MEDQLQSARTPRPPPQQAQINSREVQYMITYQDKPWLKHYDPGVPHSLAPYPRHPLHQYLADAATADYGATAVITAAHLPLVGQVASHMSYGTLNDLADALAVALGDLGLKKATAWP